MRAVFVDTAYWIALLNPHDDLHEPARRVSASLQAVRLTSEAILLEWLNDFAEALTYDRHFEQAGFKALLRRQPS